MSDQYRIEVQTPMLHLAERNLLLKIFQERIKIYHEHEGKEQEPCEIKLALLGYWQKRQETKPVLEMSMQRGGSRADLPTSMQLEQKYRIDLHEGCLSLKIKVWRETKLAEAEVSFLKSLVVNMAEALKLFANGDVFMKVGVEKLIAEIASETGVEDPAAWVRDFLIKSPYMKTGQSELRHYYRLYNNHLNHAHPQILLARREEDLIEAPV